MSVIPNHLYTKDILSQVDDLICLGYSSFSMLSRADQDRMISVCMSELGSDSYVCIFDEIDHVMNKFNACVLTGKSTDMKDLFEGMRESAIRHFQDDLDEIFSYRSAANTFNDVYIEGKKQNVFATTNY